MDEFEKRMGDLLNSYGLKILISALKGEGLKKGSSEPSPNNYPWV